MKDTEYHSTVLFLIAIQKRSNISFQNFREYQMSSRGEHSIDLIPMLLYCEILGSLFATKKINIVIRCSQV